MSEIVKHEAGELSRPEILADADDVDVLRRSVCKDLNDAELRHFIRVCRARDLDPMQRQIYAFRSGGRVQHMPSIDGFRTLAARTGRRDGMDGPFWCGDDGEWRDVWLGRKPPAAARVAVYVKGESRPYTATATWEMYGGSRGVWAKGGPHMLAKCAEALALRQAFPDQLSGLYTTDEMAQAGFSEPKPEPQLDRPAPPPAAEPQALTAQPQGGLDALAGDEPAATLVEAEFVEPRPPTKPVGTLPVVPFGQQEGSTIDTVGREGWEWVLNSQSKIAARFGSAVSGTLAEWSRYLILMDDHMAAKEESNG